MKLKYNEGWQNLASVQACTIHPKDSPGIAGPGHIRLGDCVVARPVAP